MKNKMERRDFLYGTQIAIGALLLYTTLSSCPEKELNFSLPLEYYWPTKTGMRGSHDGSWEVMPEQIAGKTWTQPSQTEDPIPFS